MLLPVSRTDCTQLASCAATPSPLSSEIFFLWNVSYLCRIGGGGDMSTILNGFRGGLEVDERTVGLKGFNTDVYQDQQ